MIEPHSPEFDLFVPNAVDADATPILDFRFCDFSVPPFAFHIWSGRLYHHPASFPRSTSSAMLWRLQDCTINSGRILLGVPLDYDGDYGAGSVSWINNIFARVAITLDPCQFVPRAEEPNESPINVDLEFEAYNNLFRGGRLQLNPIPATGHDWLLRDNLFDKVAFQQFVDQTDGTIGPLDHDYNAYWPRTVAELESDPWYVDHLLANTTDRSPGDTVNNRELGATPAYQSGPLGDYYLATSSELYSTSPDKRGSRTVAEAGLYHYTTRTDQTKDGAQTGNVIIGRHYVAAASSSSTLPKDTDSDGIHDFVENWHGDGDTGVNRVHTDYETDWNNPTTDTDPDTSTPIADSLNAKYDNIDLSGSGLTGWVKKALGLQPFSPINPLVLTQVAGNNQNVISFEVPNYDAVQNAGFIALNVDGHNMTVGSGSRAPNGNTLLTWNSSYDTPGQHYLQVEIMSSAPAEGGELMVEDDSDDAEVFAADTPPAQRNMGVIVPFYSANMVQLFRNNSMFNDNGASLNVLAAEPSAAYTIDVYDASTMTLLAQKTGSAMNGIISENWPGTYSNGSQFSGNTVQVVYNVPPASPTTATLNRVTSSETMGPHDGFEFAYFYTPKSTSMRSAYGVQSGIEGSLWRGMKRAVNALLAPLGLAFGSPNYYVSGFNYYDFQGGNPHGNGSTWGYPGYLSSQADVNVMIADMTQNLDVKNMYISGHGNSTYVMSSAVQPFLYLDCQVIADDVGNTDFFWGASGAPGNPYRFVFLDACYTASGNFWPNAFGILPLAPNAAGNNPALGPQAFVGWGGLTTDWGSEIRYWPLGTYAERKSVCTAWSYSQTLGDFYEQWQTGLYSLKECLDYASTADQRGQVPLSVGPGRRKFTCYSNMGPSPYQSFSFKSRVAFPARIYVIGHSGLMRNNWNPQHDGDPRYTR